MPGSTTPARRGRFPWVIFGQGKTRANNSRLSRNSSPVAEFWSREYGADVFGATHHLHRAEWHESAAITESPRHKRTRRGEIAVVTAERAIFRSPIRRLTAERWARVKESGTRRCRNSPDYRNGQFAEFARRHRRRRKGSASSSSSASGSVPSSPCR